MKNPGQQSVEFIASHAKEAVKGSLGKDLREAGEGTGVWGWLARKGLELAKGIGRKGQEERQAAKNEKKRMLLENSQSEQEVLDAKKAKSKQIENKKEFLEKGEDVGKKMRDTASEAEKKLKNLKNDLSSDDLERYKELNKKLKVAQKRYKNKIEERADALKDISLNTKALSDEFPELVEQQKIVDESNEKASEYFDGKILRDSNGNPVFDANGEPTRDKSTGFYSKKEEFLELQHGKPKDKRRKLGDLNPDGTRVTQAQVLEDVGIDEFDEIAINAKNSHFKRYLLNESLGRYRKDAIQVEYDALGNIKEFYVDTETVNRTAGHTFGQAFQSAMAGSGLTAAATIAVSAIFPPAAIFVLLGGTAWTLKNTHNQFNPKKGEKALDAKQAAVDTAMHNTK